MVAVGVEVDTKEVERELSALAKEYGEATVKAAVTSAQLIRGEAIKSIQYASMGTIVTRHTSTGQPYEHVAAKPGAAPNTDTGALVNSIQVEGDAGGLLGQRAKGIFVGTRLPYGAYLEYGTKGMLARPWLWPALDRKRADILKIFGKRINDVTQENQNL